MSERDLASRVGIPERMLPVPCVPIPFVGSITQFKTQVCEVGSPLGTTLYGPRFLAIRYLLILSHIESDIRIRRRDVRSGATRPRKRLKLSSKLYGYPTRRYELPDCNLRYTWDVSSIVLRTRTGGIPRVSAVVKRQKSPHTAASFFVMPRTVRVHGVALATREDPGDPSRLHTWFGCRACTRNTHRIHSTPGVQSPQADTPHTVAVRRPSSDRLVWSPLLHVPARAHEIQGGPRGASHRQPEPPPTTEVG